MIVRIIKLVGSSFFFLFDSLFRLLKRIFRMQKSRVLALMYHDIIPSGRRSFISQLEMILKYTTVIKAEEGSVPDNGKRYTIITFDDAFNCLMENVVPEMDKREIPWTIFVPTAYLGKLPGWKYWGNGSGNYNIVDEQTLSQLSQNSLITVGSHSETHRRFSELSIEERKKEFANSREKLEKITGKKINNFSAPFGDCDKNIIAQAREEGYDNIFTIMPVYITLQDGRLGYGRIQVDPSDWKIEFFLKLMGAYRWLPTAFFLKRKIKKLFRK